MRKGIAFVSLVFAATAAGTVWGQRAPVCRTRPQQQPVCTQQGTQANCAAGQQSSDDNRLPPAARYERSLGTVGVWYGGRAVVNGVGSGVRNAVDLDRVKDVPAYGKITTNIPIIGAAAGSVPIVPTTLGDAPIVGNVIQDIPVVGNIIAGPPPPWLVGAVAVDTYVLPKVSPCGYTESSMFTQTDFNSPPRLRHYKNYLAPLPYTHPPVYAPSTLETGQPRTIPDVALEGPSISIEN